MDKIKKIIFTLLGLLMILNILGVDLDVFAADFSYTDTDYSIYYDTYTPGVSDDGSYRFKYSDFTEWSGWTDKNVAVGSYDNVTGEQTVLGRIGFRWYGNNTNYFKKNNLYTVQIELRFGTKEARQLFYDNYVLFYVRANTTASQEGNSYKYINPEMSVVKSLDPDSNGTMFITIKFVPNADLKFVRFDFVNKYLNPIENTTLSSRLDTLAFGRIRYYNSTITYTEDSSALIENQTNVIQQQTEKLNNSLNNMMEIFQKENQDTNDVLTDSTPPEGTDQFVDDMVGYLPPGPVDSILNLPLQFLNKYVDGLTGSCSPINLPLPFVDETLTLQCPNRILSQIDGIDYLYTLIGLVGASYMIFKYLMSLYIWVDRTLTLRENNEPGYFDEP